MNDLATPAFFYSTDLSSSESNRSSDPSVEMEDLLSDFPCDQRKLRQVVYLKLSTVLAHTQKPATGLRRVTLEFRKFFEQTFTGLITPQNEPSWKEVLVLFCNVLDRVFTEHFPNSNEANGFESRIQLVRNEMASALEIAPEQLDLIVEKIHLGIAIESI